MRTLPNERSSQQTETNDYGKFIIIQYNGALKGVRSEACNKKGAENVFHGFDCSNNERGTRRELPK